MGTWIQLTKGPTRRSTVATHRQALADVVEVIAFKEMVLALQMYELSGTSPVATVTIETSMQNSDDSDSLWTTVATFTTPVNVNSTNVQSITSGLLRFVRWKVVLSGTSPAFNFDITGVGRAG